jgi:NAD+ kinase
MQIGIYGNRLSKEDRPWVEEFLDDLIKGGHELSVYTILLDLLPFDIRKSKKVKKLQFSKDIEEFDLDMMISLGGDGTMLGAVVFSYRYGLPVLGVNLGRLGFLASIEKSDARAAVEDILLDRFTVEERSLIHLESTPVLFGESPIALNDFTVFKRDTSSMIAIHAYINGEFLNTYWSDGIIISTPTGSTGYSLSCGGPIVFPGSGNFVITPVATHNLNVRPLVIKDDSVISLELEGRTDSFLCSLDSRFERINGNYQLALRRSEYCAKIIHLSDYSFAETLRKKLTWGVDKRSLK